MTKETIPVIDISPISLKKGNLKSEQFSEVSYHLAQALSTWGFAYLKNHGIPKQTIKSCFQQSKEFFALPQNLKDNYSRSVHSIQGYSSKGREILEDKNLYEFKESLDVQSVAPSCILPDEALPKLRISLKDLSSQIKELSSRLLHCLAIDLQINPEHFLEKHSGILGNELNNESALRLLHYPPIDNVDSENKITRCGKHTDYGGLTLLFQDALGGLEVQTLDGNQWAKAPPIEDTIVVNIGDLLQFWSGGRYRATSHRVIVDGQSCKEARYSIAAFIHPNHDTPIKPFHDHVIRGSQQKKSALEHIKQRFSETYLN